MMAGCVQNLVGPWRNGGGPFTDGALSRSGTHELAFLCDHDSGFAQVVAIPNLPCTCSNPRRASLTGNDLHDFSTIGGLKHIAYMHNT
jgi:hypothetical protein